MKPTRREGVRGFPRSRAPGFVTVESVFGHSVTPLALCLSGARTVPPPSVRHPPPRLLLAGACRSRFLLPRGPAWPHGPGPLDGEEGGTRLRGNDGLVRAAYNLDVPGARRDALRGWIAYRRCIYVARPFFYLCRWRKSRDGPRARTSLGTVPVFASTWFSERPRTTRNTRT
jgi:hypothetical protein